VAAAGYERVLAAAYDALKRARAGTRVIGGALCSHGSDDPAAPRATHSPGRFLVDLGRAYRASGRRRPIMDALALHPYQFNSRSDPVRPSASPRVLGIGDYGRLVSTLHAAFHGTAQPGTKLPVLYAEFGVQSRIPPAKTAAYVDVDAVDASDAVSEALQGDYYARAIARAACQPTVIGILLFHLGDEADLARWQSGIYYADGTPKSDFERVRDAVVGAGAGRVRCPGFAARVRPHPVRR
jgi:hypothetical protein